MTDTLPSSPLLSLPPQTLSTSQLALYTRETLRVTSFNEPLEATPPLPSAVLAVDIGGSKLSAQVYMRDEAGALHEGKEHFMGIAREGLGFADFLKTINETIASDIPVGVSIAGIVSKGMIDTIPNLTYFRADSGKDISTLFPGKTVTVLNDAEAGLFASRAWIKAEHPSIEHILLVINGSGLGGSMYSNQAYLGLEPGHVPVIPALNPFGIQTKCALSDDVHPCVEKVAAGVAGIEPTWKQETGLSETAEVIAGKMLEGDTLATQLFAASALLLAHTTIGMGAVDQLWKDPGTVAVVCHGGIFQVPGYFERVEQLVSDHLEQKVLMVNSATIDTNVCMLGAAMMAKA